MKSNILYQGQYYRIELLGMGVLHEGSLVNYSVISQANDRAEHFTLDFPSALMTAKNFDKAMSGVFAEATPNLTN